MKPIGVACLLVASFIVPFVVVSMVSEKDEGVFTGAVQRVLEQKGDWLSTISFDVKSEDGTERTFTFKGVACDLYFGVGDKVEVIWERRGFYRFPLECRVLER